jgi:hypothetical protein
MENGDAIALLQMLWEILLAKCAAILLRNIAQESSNRDQLSPSVPTEDDAWVTLLPRK